MDVRPTQLLTIIVCTCNSICERFEQCDATSLVLHNLRHSFYSTAAARFMHSDCTREEPFVGVARQINTYSTQLMCLPFVCLLACCLVVAPLVSDISRLIAVVVRCRNVNFRLPPHCAFPRQNIYSLWLTTVYLTVCSHLSGLWSV